MPLEMIEKAKSAAGNKLKLAGLFVLALAAMMIPAPAGALALPVFGVNVEHQADPVSETPGVITRADKVFSYSVAFSNSGTAVAGPEVGDTLNCSTGTWTNLPVGYSAFEYRWLHNATPIAGKTANTYTVAAGDAGQAIQCAVSATNATGKAEFTSNPVTIPSVPGGIPPVVPIPPSTFAPGIEGTLQVGTAGGAKLTCPQATNPAWTGSPTFSNYKWFRSGVEIPGAISSEYIVTQADLATAGSFQCSLVGTANGVSVLKGFSNARSTTLPGPSPSMPLAAGSNSPVAGVTIPQTTVEVTLPVGVTAVNLGGIGWTCTKVVPYKCTRATTPALGSVAFPSIAIPVTLDGIAAPDEPTATATISGGGAVVGASDSETFTLAPRPPYGASFFSASSVDSLGNPYTQAGGHPYAGLSLNTFTKYVSTNHKLLPIEDPKTISVELPPGFIGNPLRLPKCDADLINLRECPVESQIGTITLEVLNSGVAVRTGVFSINPTGGHPAEFAFVAGSVGEVHLFPKVRSDSDYGITMTSPNNTQAALAYVHFNFWGVPADPSHDSERCIFNPAFGACTGGASSSAPLRALLTNPTNCNADQISGFVTDSWQNPGVFRHYESAAPQTTGCAALNNNWTSIDKPSISFKPDNDKADTPVGYDINIHVPQEGLEDPDALATPNLYGSTVTLPEGVAISSAAANGLESCSEAQMGLTSEKPVHFDLSSPACPDASKVGTMEVQTPMLVDPLKGSVYLAAQDANPFHSRFGLYLTIDDKVQGLMLKLAGKVTADPVTGQLKAEFMENPQLPFTDLRLHFFDGPNAALVNPPTCGTYTTKADLTPWSAVDPAHPTAAETASPTSSYNINSGPNGGKCAVSKSAVPFAPTLSAGSQSVKAGASTPFVLDLTRADGQQELSSLNVVTPKGLTASLKGIPYCSEAQIAAARALTKGAAEQANPSCPAASQLGTVTTGAGSGPAPFYAHGKAYLAGPYKGAPLSLAIITPAVAGPFDLGNVVVRAGLYLDPVTAQITVKSDPIPQMLEGVPLRVRSVSVAMDRSKFMLNPTNCSEAAVKAEAVGSGGATAQMSSRYQVGACSSLAFTPKLALNLKGGTQRNDHPALTATLTQPEGQANIGSVSVALPHSEFLDQAHIRTVCTRVQFAAKACPAGSIYGSAEAISPLLDQPLTGPVYLRSSDNKLPDLVVALRGPDSQPIEIELAGRIDSVNGGIRNSFELVPDAAVSKFVLKMRGGKKGLLVNSRDICKRTEHAVVRMVGQNGKRADQFPKLSNSCKAAKQAKKARR